MSLMFKALQSSISTSSLATTHESSSTLRSHSDSPLYNPLPQQGPPVFNGESAQAEDVRINIFEGDRENDQLVPNIEVSTLQATENMVTNYFYYFSLSLVSLISSVPSGVNSLVVAVTIADSSSACEVGDLDCILSAASKTTGIGAVGVVTLPMMAFIANFLVGFVFIPPTYTALVSKFRSEQKSPRSLFTPDNVGIALGIMSSVVFIIQGINALTLCRYFISKTTDNTVANIFGWILDYIVMLLCNVAASVSTRLIGGMRIANAAVLWAPYCYDMMPDWMFFSNPSCQDRRNYANQRQLLTFLHHFQYYFVRLSSAERKDVLGMIDRGEYFTAVGNFYDKLAEKAVKPEFGFFTRAFIPKLISYAVAVASTWIMYNIIYSPFEKLGLPFGACAALAIFLAPPSFIYYIFALGRVVDQAYDTFHTIEDFYSTTYQMNAYFSYLIARSILLLAFVAALLSSGNFMYSGYDQGSKGNYYYMIDSKSDAEFLFGAVGSFISGIVNLYSFLIILKRCFDKEYAKLDDAVKVMSNFIIDSRTRVSTAGKLLGNENSQEQDVARIAGEVSSFASNSSSLYGYTSVAPADASSSPSGLGESRFSCAR